MWAIDGDGCFQMTNQELATCALKDIPIKVAIINNGASAWSASGRRCSTTSATPTPTWPTRSREPPGTRIPDFVKLAEAYGCVGLRCESPEDVDAVIEQAMAINDRPVVIDFIVHQDAMVWPMVAGRH